MFNNNWVCNKRVCLGVAFISYFWCSNWTWLVVPYVCTKKISSEYNCFLFRWDYQFVIRFLLIYFVEGCVCSLVNSFFSFFCRTWELTAAWTGVQIKVPVKFIVGDLDITYNTPGVKEYIHNGGFKRDVRFLQELIVMEGVAHFKNQERPEEISAHIYDFIKKY